ncbi:MAG: pyruvate kinase [Candidatus Margulisbacteria bacterium GWF2_35_9]|nr:MAG: pyruvate kinase [Candidatus Margulisbacteria bacterium GWF2_35_9]
MSQMNNTKIIATLGPVSNTEDMMIKLINSGADVFRLNTSHGNKEEHLATIKLIRKVSEKLNQPITILLDLQGPKIRLGIIPEIIILEAKQVITLVEDTQTTDIAVIPVDYRGFIQAVDIGDKIFINDGKVELKVVEKTINQIQALVINGGEISSKKGINMPGIVTTIPAITEKDKDYIKFGIEHEVDYFALSFVRTMDDVEKAKQFIKKHKGNIPVIAKIEKPQAIENMDDIIRCADCIMVARGDLGIEILPEKVPIVQKELIHRANLANKPVIVATQMLESMITESIPTRAEANDVANAIMDGADAVMLSGETTVGKYPIQAVEMMNRIASNVEQSNMYKMASKTFLKDNLSHDVQLARMFNELEVKAVIAITESGYTAQILSNSKIIPPIIAICNNIRLCRQLNLLWGVIPFMYKKDSLEYKEQNVEEICKQLISSKIISKGDKVVFVGGLPSFTLNKTTVVKYFQT